MARRAAVLSVVLFIAISPVTGAAEPAEAPRRDRYGDALPERALFRLGTPRSPGAGVFLGLAPDGKTLAASARDARALILWDVATGRERHILLGHEFEVTSTAFSPDGRLLASGSRDWTIRLWDVATGKELHKLEGDS